jgi:hypothetical protein
VESFFSRDKAELLEGGAFEDVSQARSETFGYLVTSKVMIAECGDAQPWAIKVRKDLSGDSRRKE